MPTFASIVATIHGADLDANTPRVSCQSILSISAWNGSTNFFASSWFSALLFGKTCWSSEISQFQTLMTLLIVQHTNRVGTRSEAEFTITGICQSTTLHIELCTFLKHLWSSSTYSDTLNIRLHMLCNSAPPPASAPPHMPPPLVCLFVCLPLSLVHMLFVCFPFQIVSINWWAVDQC